MLSAGRQDDLRGADALASLCEKYWYPLYAFIRRRGYAVERAQELAQEFFARVLEKRYIDRADRSRGRFRTFLLSSLTYFLSDEVDRRCALKRGGAFALLPFEVESGEEIYQREPAHDETPEKIFDRRWALALLDRVLVKLQSEFASSGQSSQFERLKVVLLGGREDLPYAELAREMETTEGASRWRSTGSA